MITALQIIGGLVLLFVGGEVLVRGAVALARDLGLSAFVIGMTVVAYGTSSPELIISVQSAFNGFSDIAIGNVVGSNISNILCVLGLSALIFPIAIDKKAGLRDGVVLLGSTILLLIFALTGKIGLIAGLVFSAALIIYTYMIFKKARKEKNALAAAATEEIESEIKLKLNLWQAGLLCLAGIGLLILGADVLIKGATTLALAFGISEATIGVTIIAFGGSVPELVTSLMAAFHRRSDIALGNVIGSNMFNVMGVMGITGVISPINIDQRFINFDLPILILVTAILLGLIYFAPRINRIFGAIFFGGYIAYILPQFV